jgi:hypothetical protein
MQFSARRTEVSSSPRAVQRSAGLRLLGLASRDGAVTEHSPERNVLGAATLSPTQIKKHRQATAVGWEPLVLQRRLSCLRCNDFLSLHSLRNHIVLTELSQLAGSVQASNPSDDTSRKGRNAMSLSTLSIPLGARSTADLFRDQRSIAPSAGDAALVASVVPAICLLLMCLLENPWLAASVFIPAYGVFWLNVRSAAKER